MVSEEPCYFTCEVCHAFVCDTHFDTCCIGVIPPDNVLSRRTKHDRHVIIQELGSESGSGSGSADEDDIPTADSTVSCDSSNAVDDQWQPGPVTWRVMRDQSVPHFEYTGTREQAIDTRLPIDYFLSYYNHDHLEELCQMSMIYARKLNPNSEFTLKHTELRQYMGIILYMTLVKLGSSRRYWASATRVSQVADTMSNKRFDAITKRLHFSADENATGSRTHKFQYVIDKFNESAAHLKMDENLSVDEQIIAYKGKKSSLRQYNPKKPKKWGWKLFVLCGKMGLIHKLEFYGKPVQSVENTDHIGKSGQVVLRLASIIPRDKNYKLYFDNWFNSPFLQVALAKWGIQSVGTLNINRAKGLSFTKSASKERRGTYTTKTAEINGVNLFATTWIDNKPVHLLSTFSGSETEIQVERFDRLFKQFIAVPAPSVIRAYNTHMGYVDEINSYLARFRMTTHCRARAYLKIFFHFINIAVTNAWIEYRRDCDDVHEPERERMSLHDFKADVATSLMQTNVTRKHFGRKSLIEEELKKKRGPITNAPPQAVRTDNIGHWPGLGPRGPRCKVPSCDAKPLTMCTKCNVYLCINAKNCFVTFHNV